MKSSSSSSSIGGRCRTPAHAFDEDDWEAMFHPHYSIDSPRHKRPARRRDSKPLLPLLSHSIATSEIPSLPPIGVLAHPNNDSLLSQHQHQHQRELQQESLSLSSFGNVDQHQHQQSNSLWADRVDVLRAIREGSSDTRHLGAYTSSSPHVSQKQKGALAEFWERLKQDAKQERPPNTITDEDETIDSSEKSTSRPFRLSFLMFAFGFLFPPLWIVGALHIPYYKEGKTQHQRQRQSPEGQSVDLQWRRRSRNAFFIFITTMLVLLILTIVLKPASIGWRISAQSLEGIAHY
ncbi:hypothetical protein BX666DRAFT_1906074 [Dichotomocladium elegans]|nr:hypothetical protein BX666DRAFT_1906074 [Dichotomocladium elegans]